MGDTGRAVETIYDAAAGGSSWTVARETVMASVGAHAATLIVSDAIGATRELLWRGVPEPGIAAYERHFHTVDLYSQRSMAAAALRPPGAPAYVYLGGESLVPDAEFLRSAFHNDFCRHYGLRHIMGTSTAVGGVGFLMVAVHRPPERVPFAEAERGPLALLLPHLVRGLQIRQRIGSGPAIGFAALDALPVGVAVTDGAGAAVFVNRAAEALASAGAGLVLRRPSASAIGERVQVTAANAADAERLGALIRLTAAGGPGGAVRLRAPEAQGLAVLVAPLPARLSGRAADRQGRLADHALLLLRPLEGRPTTLPAPMLRELFGLTRAEADVARLLVGGASKGAVAAARGLRETTVRSQVRALLDKTGTANLRDLERLLAGLQDAAMP